MPRNDFPATRDRVPPAGADRPAASRRTVLRLAAAAGAGAAFAPRPADAQPARPRSDVPGDAWVDIREAWVRPAFALPAGTGAYLTLRARMPLRLVGGRTDAAGAVRVRRTAARDGVGLQEDEPQGVDLAPGERVVLAPGGRFLGLDDLRRPLRIGDRVRLRLDFLDGNGRTHARDILATVRTGPPGRPAPAGHGHGSAREPEPGPAHGHGAAPR